MKEEYDSMKNLEAAVAAQVARMNHIAREKMDNLSPLDISQLIYHPFEETCPLAFRQDLTSETVLQMPFMKLLHGFLLEAAEPRGIQLTKGGNLNVKLVKSLYGQRLLLDEMIERGFCKLNKEKDVVWIQNIRLLATLSGLAKNGKEQLTLTARGRKLVEAEDWPTIFQWVFLTQLRKFNMGYHDGYPETDAQLLCPYVLYLLVRYGHDTRPLTFYVEKFVQAFPILLTQAAPTHGTPTHQLQNMLGTRLFNRFLKFYGMVDVVDSNEYYKLDGKPMTITTTKLFTAALELRSDRFAFTRPEHLA
ncbi:MAG: hypothetical protein WBA17_01940 [Saprospiraceae bacterium]